MKCNKMADFLKRILKARKFGDIWAAKITFFIRSEKWRFSFAISDSMAQWLTQLTTKQQVIGSSLRMLFFAPFFI